MPRRPISRSRRRRLRKVAGIKASRTVRPVGAGTEMEYLDRLRARWKEVPLPSAWKGQVFPDAEFMRVLMDRKGTLFAMSRNLSMGDPSYFYRVFKVQPRTLELTPVASAEIEVGLDGILLVGVAREGLRPSLAEYRRSDLRPRGQVLVRPLIEEAIRLAKLRGKRFIYLRTHGAGRLAYYARFGFVPAQKTKDAITLAHVVREG